MPTESRRAAGPLLALLLLLALAAAILFSLAITTPARQARAGWDALRAGRYSEAVAAFESAINGAGDAKSPGYDPPLTRLGLSYAYLARRDFARAAAVLPRGGKLAPWIELQRGLVAAASGNTTAAVANWRALLAANPPAPVLRAALWHVAEANWPKLTDELFTLAAIEAPGDPYVAAANLRLAQAGGPNDQVAARRYLATAQATLPLKRQLAAAPDLHLGPAFDEGFSEPLLRERLTQMASDLNDLARLGLSGGDLQAYWGRAFEQQDEWAWARYLLLRAAAAQPNVADIRAYLGLALQRLGDPVGAEREMLRALQMDPQRTLAQHLLARLFIEQKRWDDALPYLEDALHAAPNNVVLHLDIAEWYTAQGSYVLAESEYNEAEQLQQALGGAAEVNTSLVLANFYLERNYALGGCELSREAARRAVARNPGSDEYDALGWAQHLCGNTADALAALRTAVRLDPTSPRAHYHLGVLLKETGQPQQARRELELAGDLDPGGAWEQRATAAIVRR